LFHMEQQFVLTTGSCLRAIGNRIHMEAARHAHTHK